MRMDYPSFTVAALLLAAFGCGKAPPPAPEKKVAESPPPPAVDYFRVNTETAGSIHGTILFYGVRPKRKPIDMTSDAGCIKANDGKPVFDEPVVTGKNGGLTDSFVYIQAGLEDKKFAPRADPVALNQHGCMFEPRVIGIRAGQYMNVKNSDPVSHNIHPKPTNNYDWNEQQSPGAVDLQHRFPRADIMIPVKCNVHSWMRAYIGVVDHPYFAVTGPDGSFELKNVPPGNYTVAVWHEELGEQKSTVRLAASGTAAVNFVYR